jgi:hypothetical protein
MIYVFIIDLTYNEELCILKLFDPIRVRMSEKVYVIDFFLK